MNGPELNRLFLGIFSPGVLAMLERFPPPPGLRDPFGDDAPPLALPPAPTKPTRRGVPANRRNRDQTRYRFLSPEGVEFVGTRTEFAAQNPGINPGQLHDLVKGKGRSAKGWLFLGIQQPAA